MRLTCKWPCLILIFLLTTSPKESFGAPRASDFDGDQRDEIGIWDPVGLVFSAFNADGSPAVANLACGRAGDYPVSGDFNRDSVADVAVWRPVSFMATEGQNGAHFDVCYPGATLTGLRLGSPADVPITLGDFNGDGLSDLATYRKNSGLWYEAFPGTLAQVNLGSSFDVPAPADYDGDGFTDEAVFNLRTAIWQIKKSGTETVIGRQWGLPTDMAVPADYDGDGKADIAVWRPIGGVWFIINSGGTPESSTVQLGLPGDYPLPGDYNGDGRAEAAVYRPSTGYIYFQNGTGFPTAIIGGIPVNALRQYRSVNDFDGDAQSDYAVVRPINNFLNWLIADARGTPFFPVLWGLPGDQIAARDYNGDGRTEPTVVRNLNGYLNWFFRGTNDPVLFGLGGDTLVPADYDGDRKSDLAVLRPYGNGINWYIKSSLTGQTNTRAWGLVGDTAAGGDFDGNGSADPTVVRNLNGLLYWFSMTINPITMAATELPVVQWGLAGDQLYPGDYDGDHVTDYAVVRQLNGELVLLVRTAAGAALSPIHWGLSGDNFIPGQYRGEFFLQPGVYRAGTDLTYYVNEFPAPTRILRWGLRGDVVVPYPGPAGAPGNPPVTADPGTPSTPTTPGAGLGTVCPSVRGWSGSGMLWKPESQDSGGTREGKPMSLFSRNNPGSSCLKVFASNGSQVSALGKYDANRWYVGWGCGDKKSAAQIASAARSSSGSGLVYLQTGSSCIGPFDPTLRRDGR